MNFYLYNDQSSVWLSFYLCLETFISHKKWKNLLLEFWNKKLIVLHFFIESSENLFGWMLNATLKKLFCDITTKPTFIWLFYLGTLWLFLNNVILFSSSFNWQKVKTWLLRLLHALNKIFFLLPDHSKYNKTGFEMMLNQKVNQYLLQCKYALNNNWNRFGKK